MNKIFSYRFRYFFRRRFLHMNSRLILSGITPNIKLGRGNNMGENIRRWEDDGGRIVDEITSTTEKLPVQPTDHN